MSYDILIVDDSSLMRALVKRTLKISGLPIGALYEAADGQCGLDVLAARHVDLVLADLHMPRMGGLEMTNRIMADEQTRDIPVVVISADPDGGNNLIDSGIKGYLHKPFTPESLCSLLTEVLGVAHD